MDTGLQTIKLSELPEAIALNESDYSLIVQNGTSKKIKGLLLKGNAGDNGKSIEVQKTDTHIQWRQEGGRWINLVALADLKGDKGEQGEGANVDLTDYATKVWVTQQLASYYTKAEIDLSLSNKANISHAHTEYASIDHAHNYNDLTNKPTIPSKTSDLENDSGFLTSIPSEYVTEEEMSTALSNKANKSDIPSLEGYATENFVTNKIAEASLSSGEVDLSGYATKDDLTSKVDKIEGKSLSTNDLTNELKSNYDDAYLHSKSTHVQASDIPTKTSDLENDSGFITSIPEEYITETELNAKGYLTSHQDISGLQTKTDNSLTTTSKEIVGAINSINEQLNTIANNGTTVEVLERVTKEEIERQIQDGTLANLTIADGSITQEKLSPDLELGVKDNSITLNKINGDLTSNKYVIENSKRQWAYVDFILDGEYSNCEIKAEFTCTPVETKTVAIQRSNQNTNAIQFQAGVTKKYEVSASLTTPVNYFRLTCVDGMTTNLDGVYENIKIWVDGELKGITDVVVRDGSYRKIKEEVDFLATHKFVEEALDKLKINISNEYMERFNLYPLDSNVINPPSDFLNGAIVNIEIDGISNEDYKKGLFIRRLSNSYSWATIANIDVCCGDETDKIFSSQLANYSGKVTMDNTCTYVFKAINGHIGTLKITIDFSKITANTNKLYTKEQTLLSREVIKNVKGLNETVTKLPFVNNLYVVQGSKRKQSVPIFIDYLYKGSKDKILFENGEDRTYIREAVGYPNSQSVNIQNTKETLKFKSDTLNVEDITFNKISIAENTENGDIRLLIIGDSVTAGAITQKQYWAVANELFAKEDIDRNRTSKVMFLGSNNVRKETVEYNGKTKDIKSCACGISSWSLNHWLTNSSSHFVYDNNGTPTFSILKWIERYRTHLDDGTKLELGDSRLGTEITSSNIDNIQCCTPNIVYINSTHNGGNIEQHEQMIDIIRNEIPNCKIIVGNPMPLTGTWNKEKYVGIDWLDDNNIQGPNYDWSGSYGTSRIENLNYYVEKERNNNWFYFMPQCVTMPTVESLEYDLVDCGVKQMKQVTKVNQMPKEHPGTLTHKIWGYELYALLKYISGIEQGVTNNFDTVPLFV